MQIGMLPDMSVQIAVRLPNELAAALDGLVEPDGPFMTKADAVRSAIEELVDRDRRRRIGEAIAEGYRRIPQTDAEIARVHEDSIRSIEEEPWEKWW
jgi:Arc/MetJ-type ribon-helix-helix transcriptional regulator